VQERRRSNGQGRATLELSELVEEIKDFIRGAWRYRWGGILLAWGICLVSWGFVLSMPDVYRASSRLHIDTKDSLQPLLAGMAIESNLLDDVNVMLKSIISRPTLEKIAAQSGFDLGNPDPEEMDSLMKRLAESLEIELDREQVLEISIEHANASVAYAVVSVLIEIFVEDLMGTTRSDTKSAQDFLEKKLVEYEELLADAEQRLADFKKRNIGQMPGERGGYYARLQGEMQTLDDLDSRIRLARQRRDALELQMAGEEPTFGVMNLPPGGSFSSPQIAALEAELTQLRLSYTDSHPDVIRVKELLENMRAEGAARQSGTRLPSASAVDQNPVYQQMKIQFSQADLELSQLQIQRSDQARIVSNLKTKIDTIPEIEAELTKLNRNYDVYQAQYNELVQRLEKARLSEDVEQSSTGLNFRLIDPPSVGSTPVGPDRGLLATLGLVVAILISMGLAALRNIATPVFYSSHKLERIFGVPVIGTIKRFRSPTEIAKLRMSTAMLSVSVVALVACYAVIIVFDQASAKFASQIVDIIG